jgi:hypothetical protein
VPIEGLGLSSRVNIWLMDGRSMQLVVIQHASELRRLAEHSDHKLRILAMDVTDPVSIHATATELNGQAIDLLLNKRRHYRTAGPDHRKY